MDSEDQALTLGLGFQLTPKSNINYHHHHLNLKTVKRSILVDDHQPHLTLSLSGETLHPRPPPCSASVSAASSLSNTPPNGVIVSVKRERETASSEDFETEHGCNSRTSEEEEDGSGPTTTATARKKLRLTKDQSTFLEESFKQHSTLNPKQKQGLADRLNLRPRQVEVWFQNRRARTKLKQTEVDCEYLKKWCETLTDENKRLQKEVQELKALKVAQQPLYMHLPAATLTMCPSCERVGAGVPIAAAAGTHASNASFTIAAKPHFYTSFPNPSAAC